MLLTKDFVTNQEPVTPQDPDLAAIRKYAQRDLTPADVWCSAFKVCNTKVDRSGERFTKAYLERFAETLPGKAVLEGHRRDTRPVGRLYAAEVLPDGGDWFLKGYWYTAAESPIRHEVELGIAKDCSIGYAAGKRTCSTCGKMWLPYRQGECKEHQPLEEYDGQPCIIHYCDSEAHKAEGQEVSLVWLGCQYGAEATAKQYAMGWGSAVTSGSTTDPPGFYVAHYFDSDTYSLRPIPPTGTVTLGHSGFAPSPSPQSKESGMFDTLDKALVEIKRLNAALPLSAEREAELQKTISDLQGREPLAKDGQAFRQHLKDEILRMAGAIDAAEKNQAKTQMYTAILGTMEHASAESLLAVKQGIEADFNQKFAGGSGDPEAGRRLDNEGEPKKTGLLGRFATGGYW